MFEINKDERMTTEEKLLFNIQELLKEMNSKLEPIKFHIENDKTKSLAEQFPYANINVNTDSLSKNKKKG